MLSKILQIVDEHKLKPMKFAEILEHMPLLTLSLKKADLGGSFGDLQKAEVHEYKMYT